MNLNKEHEQGIRAFTNCLQTCKNLGYEIFEMHFERAGITEDDIRNIKAGKQFLTEEQFYGFADILRGSMQRNKPLMNWLDLADNWGLVGILEPTFSLKKNTNNEIINNVRAILDSQSQYVIINNPELQIDVNDSLLHQYPNGLREELFITDTGVDYASYSQGRKPLYKLTVTRSKQNMQNTNNFNIGGNFQMDGNARFNTGNVTDNSSNTFNELPPDLFAQTRKILESINSPYRQELKDILEKIENAKDNKKEGGQWLGKLLSSCFENGCVTLLQQTLEALFNHFVR